MTTIDRDLLRAVKEDLAEALAEVGQKHGLLLQFNGGKFSDASATLKLDIAVATGKKGENTMSVKAAEDWKKYAEMFGMKPAWLGKKVMHAGEAHTILGLMPKRRKFPVLVRKPSGKQLLLTAETVRGAAALGSLK